MLLFNIVKSCKPKIGIELGACLGLSAAYQAAAMKLNGSGKLVTLEGAPSFAEIASETLSSLRLSDVVSVEVGPFQKTLEPVLRRLQPIDYIFIDGHHDQGATVKYFRQVKPFLAEQAILVFDDIHWSPGMTRAWETIKRDPEVSMAATLTGMGVCVTGRFPKRHYRFMLG